MMTRTVTPTYFTTHTSKMKDLMNRSRDFELAATLTTPLIKYSGTQKKLVIRGKSTSSNVAEIYRPVVQMLKKDALDSRTVKVDINLTEINSNTLKELFSLFKYLGLKKMTGGVVEVLWRVNSTHSEMVDTGKNFSELYDLDVKIIE